MDMTAFKEAAIYVVNGLTKQPAVMFFSSITLLILLFLGVISVPNYDDWLRFGLFVIAILAGYGLIARFWHSLDKKSKDDKLKKEAINRLNYLDENEKNIFGYLLHHNQRLFSADSDGGYASKLISSGLVRIKAVRGQHVDMTEVPFEIPEFVWDELQKRRNDFPFDADKKAHPWRKPFI